MKSKSKIVLCDLNMEDRSAITANIVLACRIAKDLDAEVVGWSAIGSVIGRIRLKEEMRDLRAIANYFGVHWDYVQTGLRPNNLSVESLWVLIQMLFLALVSPRRLSRYVHRELSLGQNVVDSQRRRTLRLMASTFVVTSGEGPRARYPWVRYSRSRFVNLLALALPRFVVRCWLNWHFWDCYLSRNSILLSVQSHTERSEFAPLTRALAVRDIPVIVQLENMQVWDENLEANVQRGKAWLGELGESARYSILSEVYSNLDMSFSEKPNISRLYAETHIGSEEANREFQQQVLETLVSASFCILVMLPATYEAFNHDRRNKIFYNFSDWFSSIGRVQKLENASVVFKLHPSGDTEERSRVSKGIKRTMPSESWAIAPRLSSVSALQNLSTRVVCTSLSSSSIVEAAFLGLPVVPADVSSYMWWEFAKAPVCIADYERRLSDPWTLPRPTREQVAEAILITNHHENYFPPLRPLAPGDPSTDMNPEIHSELNVYSQSSRNRVLGTDKLDSTFEEASVWKTLLYEYRPPRMHGPV